MPVKVGLGSDELPIDPLQDGGFAGGEGIVFRLGDGIPAISGKRMHLRDSMANGAGDTRVSRWVSHIIESWFSETARQQRHRIMTAATPLHCPR